VNKKNRVIAPACLQASAITLCLSLAGATVARNASAQDNPIQALKGYDYQNRAAADAISAQIRAAGDDKSKLATIEQSLDGVLTDPDSTFAGKQEACRLISIIATGQSVPALSKMLADDKLADIARYALERDGDPAAAQALRAALATTSGKTQIGVINSLGDRVDSLAPPVLKKYVESPNVVVSEAAIAALGKIGNPVAIALLRGLPAQRVAAGHALLRAAGKLSGSGSVTEALAIYTRLAEDENRPVIIRAEAMRALAVRNGPGAAKAAVAALKSDDPYLQEVAARTIGTIGTDAAVKPALGLWPHLPGPAQIILLTAFADRRDKTAIPLAYTAIESKDPALRAAGMRSAALIGGPTSSQTVGKLLDILQHGEGGDRNVARESLASMPGVAAEQAILKIATTGTTEEKVALIPVLAERPTSSAIAILLGSLNDKHSAVAVQAAQALGRIGKHNTFNDLLKAVITTDSDEVRDAARDAAQAIAPKLHDHGAESVHGVFDVSSVKARAALCPILAEIGDERSLNDLVKLATAPGELKQPAFTALADNWSDSRPLPTLLDIANNDPDKSVRVQALRGYLRLLGQDEKIDQGEKVTKVEAAINAATRPEEKRQALSVLRECRVTAAVELAAKYLDDSTLFNDAANTILYLAAKQRKNDHDLAPVTGPAVDSALDKIIEQSKDDVQKAAAQKIKG